MWVVFQESNSRKLPILNFYFYLYVAQYTCSLFQEKGQHALRYFRVSIYTLQRFSG